MKKIIGVLIVLFCFQNCYSQEWGKALIFSVSDFPDFIQSTPKKSISGSEFYVYNVPFSETELPQINEFKLLMRILKYTNDNYYIYESKTFDVDPESVNIIYKESLPTGRYKIKIYRESDKTLFAESDIFIVVN